MNGFLLDTHAFIWFTEDSPRLNPRVRELLESHDSKIFLSAASLWEMAIKTAKGKLRLPGDPLEMARSEAIPSLDVTAQHAWGSRELPIIKGHNDPFDRLLAAQARIEGLTVLSADPVFDEYGVKRQW